MGATLESVDPQSELILTPRLTQQQVERFWNNKSTTGSSLDVSSAREINVYQCTTVHKCLNRNIHRTKIYHSSHALFLR